MSPVPSVASAFALSPAAPSVSVVPGSGGQSASVMSQHLLTTGGTLFAVVAIVSVVGYFYHGRGATGSARTNNAWISFGGFFSSMRHRGPTTTNTAAATDWPLDLEAGFEQHVSMVYARYFHPTFWNPVECHPATPSAPAIYVEEEANGNPTPDPQLPGRNSFLNMDDDDSDGDDDAKPERKKLGQDKRARVKELPPYDTSSSPSVNFSSEIIGTTVRRGTFLLVPGQLEDGDSSEDSPSESDEDFCCSPYDGILEADSEADFPCSPYDGIMTTDSESEFSCSPFDGIVATPPRSSSGTRRYGVADMSAFAQNLKGTLPEDGSPLIPTISRRDGLFNLSKFAETDPTLSCGPTERLRSIDEQTVSNCNISVNDSRECLEGFAHNVEDTIPKEGFTLLPTISGLLGHSEFTETDPNLSCRPLKRVGFVEKPTTWFCDLGVYENRDNLGDDSSDTDIVATPHDCLDLMRKLLAELRDPNMDCTSRALSEDCDSEYGSDDEEEEEASNPPTRLLYNARQNSLELTSSLGTKSDVSDKGSIHPLTPPTKPATTLPRVPDAHKDHISPLVMVKFNEEGQVMSPTFSDSPPMFPTGDMSCLTGTGARCSIHGYLW